MAQTGIHGAPQVSRKWMGASIQDDPVTQSNQRGMVSFATAGKNTRSTQFFINYRNNKRLDNMGFSPFGRIDAAGMKVVDQLYGGYGESAPRGKGPRQDILQSKGNPYLRASFPRLDYIQRASIVPFNTSLATAAANSKTVAQMAPPKPPVGQTTAVARTSVTNKALDPSKAIAKAPESFRVQVRTTKGNVVIHVKRAWAPTGADRFYNLVDMGFFNETAFFRIIPGFMAQIGLHGNPAVNSLWSRARIKDDPVVKSNERGFVTFAKTGQPNSRTTQFFINFGSNKRLDSMGFAPFGYIDAVGMKVIDALYSGYGESAPRGRGPTQGLIKGKGNSYLKQYFPNLDYIQKAYILR
jgi:peptidyl-prolyl cis-trans isomerase A (cyclophilin A)